ncbi:MAG: phosphoglycerate mutase family protein [Ekhidna sp.]
MALKITTMKKLLITTLMLVCIISLAHAQTTFILVRHAEKANDGTRNPSLNDAGKERASNLAEMLSNQEVSALYSTPYKRTQETLQPIASQKNLEIQDYDPRAGADWLKEVAAKHGEGTVVISGHSNTTPGLANALLGSQVFAQFDESDYTNLIIIVADEVGKGKLVRLKF